MPPLTGAQRKRLRGLAHGLDPIVQLGRQGLTEPVLAQIDAALGDHELIKVRLTSDRGEKAAQVAGIEARLRASCAGTIGHVAIFFRPAADPDARRIRP